MKLFLDIETTRVADFKDLSNVRTLVACWLKSNELGLRWEDDTCVGGWEALVDDIAKAKLIIGHNIINFDMPIIKQTLMELYPDHIWWSGKPSWDEIMAKCYDTSRGVKNRFGRHYKLGDLAKWNKLGEKGEIGADCERLWAEGKYRQVIEYCHSDVEITRKLYNLLESGEKINLE